MLQHESADDKWRGCNAKGINEQDTIMAGTKQNEQHRMEHSKIQVNTKRPKWITPQLTSSYSFMHIFSNLHNFELHISLSQLLL